MSFRLPLLAFAVLVAVWLPGCRRRVFPVLRPISSQTREDTKRTRAADYFVKACDYDRRGLHNMAEHFYKMAHDLDTSSVILRELLVGKYVLLGKHKDALMLIKRGRTIDELTDSEKRRVAPLYVQLEQFQHAAKAIGSLGAPSPEEHKLLGYVHERLGNLREATVYYAAGFGADPRSLPLGLKLASLYVGQGGLAKAESLYVFLDSTFGRNADVLCGLGSLSLMRGDTTVATGFLKESVMVDSTHEQSLRTLAQIHIAQGDLDSAILFYEKLSAGSCLTRYLNSRTLALLYYYNEQYDRAGQLLGSLLTDHVGDYELHFYLGLVFAAQENDGLAEMELQKTLALRDDFVDAWRHLCYLKLDRKDLDGAEECALEFTKRVPDRGASWRLHGYILSRRHEYGRAIEVLGKALSLDKEDGGAWLELGSAYERNRQFAKAADAFLAALRIDPHDHSAANYLGYMWTEQDHNLDSAKALIESALEQEPDNGAYLDSYGWVFYRLGDLDRARHFILKALDKIDDDPIVHAHLGYILADSGDPQGAVKAFRRSIELGAEDGDALGEKIEEIMRELDQSMGGQVGEGE